MNEPITEIQNSSPTSPIYNKERKFKIFTALCAVILSTVGGICFGLFFDTESKYFSNSAFVYVFYALIATAVVAAIIFSIVTKEHLAPNTRRASLWLGCLAGLEFIHLLLTLIFDKSWITAILLIAAIVYFSRACCKNTVLHTLLGIVTAVFCVAMIAKTYFSYDIPVNSPYKLICQFGIALAMLLVVSELRFDLGAGRSGIYKILSCMTFCINLCAVAASLALTFKGIDASVVYSVPACALVIYSSKIFFAHAPHKDIGTQESDEDIDSAEENQNEKGPDTHENID